MIVGIVEVAVVFVLSDQNRRTGRDNLGIRRTRRQISQSLAGQSDIRFGCLDRSLGGTHFESLLGGQHRSPSRVDVRLRRTSPQIAEIGLRDHQRSSGRVDVRLRRAGQQVG